MERKKSTSFQVVTTFGVKMLVLFGSFIISIILARALGPEGKGIVTAIFVVPNLIISLADLGVRQATTYFVGRKIYPLQDILSSVMVMWLITSIISLVVVSAYFFTGPSHVYGWGLLSIALLTIPISLFNNYITGVLLGKERIGVVNLSGLFSFIVNLFSLVLLVSIFHLGVHGAAITQVLVAFVLMIYGYFIVSKYAKFRFKSIQSIPMELTKKGISYALALFILNLNYRVDIILLERFTDTNEVGVYSVGVSLAELIWQLPAAIGIVIFSKSATSLNENEAIERSTRLLRITWLPLFLICLLFWLLSPLMVSYLYGDEYIEAVSVIRWLLPGVLMMVLFKILNADLAGRGYPIFALHVYIITFLLNVVLNLVLIPREGMNGSAIASTISYTVGAIIFGVVYARKSGIKIHTLFVLNRDDYNLLRNLFKQLTLKARYSQRKI
ncbi:oligosaccharide flippase family protein [Paenibacillus silvisoli]|uniref:oligosaccharide flippase family protein n=1 Tax=Paenibacillus silvisoli TaxID=3110539 RepID=UPI0028063916|nr:polysaccharide biosynthesis C-terminal domain-containing protein [Paenibacillus silvisoli]